MSAQKRCAAAMDVDESEQQPVAKKQCTAGPDDSVEAQFESALEQIRERAQEDQQKLVKAACKHFVDRNGIAPTEEQLINVFSALASKFVDGLTDDAEDDDEDDAEEDGDDEDASALPPNLAGSLTNSVQDALNDALDIATSLGKAQRKKLEAKVNALWKQEHGADPTSEETEAVFAVIQAAFNGAIIADGDDDAEDVDYTPTYKDQQEEAKDAEADVTEADEEPLKVVNVCIVDDTTAVPAAADDDEEVDDVEEEQVEKTILDLEFTEQEDEEYKPTEQEKAAEDDEDDMDEDDAEQPAEEYNEANDGDYNPEADAAKEEEELEKDEEFEPKVAPVDEMIGESFVA